MARAAAARSAAAPVAAAKAPAKEPPTPRVAANVEAYQIWQFSAHHGVSQVVTFTQPLRLVVAVRR